MLAGMIAGVVLLAVAELVSLAFSSSSAPFVAVGGGFIDIIPPAVKDLVVGLFGTWDKVVLFGSMIAVYLVLTALIGRLGHTRTRLAAGLFAGLGVFAMIIVLTRAQNTVLDVIPTLLGTVVAVPTLLFLLRIVHAPVDVDDAGSGWTRRRSLVGIGAVGVLAVITAATGASVFTAIPTSDSSAAMPTVSRSSAALLAA